MEDTFDYNNEDEGDMAQLHSIHLHQNAIAAVQRLLNTGPSKMHCDECGEDIPEPRRIAVQGCKTCIHCQEKIERM